MKELNRRVRLIIHFLRDSHYPVLEDDGYHCPCGMVAPFEEPLTDGRWIGKDEFGLDRAPEIRTELVETALDLLDAFDEIVHKAQGYDELRAMMREVVSQLRPTDSQSEEWLNADWDHIHKIEAALAAHDE